MAVFQISPSVSLLNSTRLFQYSFNKNSFSIPINTQPYAATAQIYSTINLNSTIKLSSTLLDSNTPPDYNFFNTLYSQPILNLFPKQNLSPITFAPFYPIIYYV